MQTASIGNDNIKDQQEATEMQTTMNGNQNANREDIMKQGIFTAETREKLAARPAAWQIQGKPGQGGKILSYVPVPILIEKANRIFGPENWGSETLRLEMIQTGTRVDQKTGEVRDRWSYISTVRVTVRNALPKDGTGLCEVAADTPDGHDTAAKGAESDALRRALRQFGTAFGNGLYYEHLLPRETKQSDDSQAQTPNGLAHTPQTPKGLAHTPQTPPAGSKSPTKVELVAELLRLGRKQGYAEDAIRTLVIRNSGMELERMSVAQLSKWLDQARARAESAA